MKRTSLWSLWLILASMTVGSIDGEFFILSGPEYKSGNLFYRNHQLRDMYCITDEMSSALTWNSNLKWMDADFGLNKVDEPMEILPNSGFVYPLKDHLTCPMDHTSTCSHHWTKTGNWSFATSLDKSMAPVFDNRWEDFKEMKMTDHWKIVDRISHAGNLALSIRGATDAHVAICIANDPSSFCFYIIMAGWSNSKSVIRKCEKGIPDPASAVPDDECLKILDSYDASIISSTEWNTFSIRWNFAEQIELSIYHSQKRILNYSEQKVEKYFEGQSDSQTGNNHYFLFARSSDQMLMKFHIYGFLWTTTTQSKLYSPGTMSTSPGKNMCIEMSITLCEKCIMTVDFIDSKGQKNVARTFTNKISNNVNGLPSWRTVKINRTLSKEMQQPVSLSIVTLLSNNTVRNNSYWGVSNVRRCFDGALKAIRIKAYQDSNGSKYFWPNVTCQKLSSDGSSKVIDATDRKRTSIKADLRTSCKEGQIGPACLVDCSKFFVENSDCQNLIACDQSGCSCAQGYMMPSCRDRCSASTYGFECKKKCGNCTDGVCSFATGECKKGCQDSRDHLFLPPYCKTGIESPPAPTIYLINATSVRLSLGPKKDYELVPTNINFEIWSNRSRAAFISEQQSIKKETVIGVDIDHLNPGTHYTAQAILRAKNKVFKGEPVNFTTPCTESVGLNFVTIVSNTSVTLDNWVDVHVNDSCPFTWYHVQLFEGKRKLFDNTTSFPRKFSHLESNTEYKLVITSERGVIVDRSIKTQEGVPGPVRSLQTHSSKIGAISISWEPPEKTRGQIVSYFLKIEATESFGCKDLNKTANFPKQDHFFQEISITNVSQNTYEHTFEGLAPYTGFRVSIQAMSSKYQGERSKIFCKTSALDTPTEVLSNLRLTYETSRNIAAYLKWDPPTDCLSITGPIRASKISIDKNFINETHDYSLPLLKSDFNGEESYDVRLYCLRNFNTPENKTAFVAFKFTMPAREPPAARNVEIVEVDTTSTTLMVRWEPPLPPLHGKLSYYKVEFCKSSERCSKDQYAIVKPTKYCDLWNSADRICDTVPMPNAAFNRLQIKVYNEDVSESSEPTSIEIKMIEFDPDAPLYMEVTQLRDQDALVNVSWSHPWKSGGRLERFVIEARLLSSNLKSIPWKENIGFLEIGPSEYHSNYSMELEVLPSSTLLVSVRAVTANGRTGEKIENRVDIPDSARFEVEDLNLRVRDDLGVIVRIPRIINDVRNSRVLLVVQGPKHCSGDIEEKKNISFTLGNGLPSVLETGPAWIAAMLEKPESYANSEFQVGDDQVYGGSRNYILCSKESYVVHLLLIDGFTTQLAKQREGIHVLKAVRTREIILDEMPHDYLSWMIPLILIALIMTLLAFHGYQKRLGSCVTSEKPALYPQENMPLSNDFSKKKPVLSSGETMKKVIKEDTPKNNSSLNNKSMPYEMPVKTEDFEAYFEIVYKNGALESEYTNIERGLTKACLYGSQLEVKPKNRYVGLFPYDDSRVILQKIPKEPYSDYINANYITGFGGQHKSYIATQGPKPNTISDFWRMIWQDKVRIVCMMTNIMENGKTKCEQYWPDSVGEKKMYGAISVEFADEEVRADHTYRTFHISYDDKEIRTIDHLHFTTWPDHGVPSNPQSIVSFLKKIQSLSPIPRCAEEPPIVVHCSAGVGRTGTLIVLDMCICQATSEKVIDVHSIVKSARRDRLNMVGSIEQYLLIHLVLVEYLNSCETCITCDERLPEQIAKAKEKSLAHFRRILDTGWWDEVLGSPPLPEKSISNRNRAKHRFPETAGGLNRLYLKRSVITDEDSDYIAATCVRNVFKDCQIITTQLPMPTTSADFWRMLSELDIELVLVLQQPNLNDPTYCELVPESQGFVSSKYLRIVRQQNLTQDAQYYIKEDVLIIDSSEPSRNQTIKIVSYKNWPESSLPEAKELVKLWRTINHLSTRNDRPLVIVCRDGVTASGLWLSASCLLAKMTTDKECDVSQAVRSVRSCRKNFLNEVENFEYLYDIALAWHHEN
ncbi:hypothetical protein QAD02_010280 [Eretmocerus hayati]|uniref:Uncharacterized protein n=1 Tax=Eretmocerus hayati TaxID=131215 RepID=A0ACC2NC30_9HYME|nr:hypothetical protein QAD02_010280 [Eretmocerus hayati]